MSEFNPYHQWLGISETERPISKYCLLAIADFENNREVISAAAEPRTIYLRTLQAGEHAVLVAEPGTQMMVAGLSTFQPSKDDL